MNVLIVVPKITSNKDEWYVFPTGIAYVTSMLKKSKICNVHTRNLNTVDDIEEDICRMIDEFDIDIVATGGLTFQYHAIRDIVLISKKHKPNIISMVGGGYITSSPVVAMTAIPEIDIGMIGEGEYTICEVVDALDKKTSLKNVRGIIFRDDKHCIVETMHRPPIEDLDSLPYPDYDAFDFESTLNFFPTNFGIYSKRSACLITSRGCPYNCTFCFHPQGDKYRTRSLDNVFGELEWLIEKYQISSVLILDELFGGNQKRLNEFCERIKKYNLKWWVETRVQFATLENLRKMKESGCAQVLLGIENVNDSILKSMNKHITVAEIENALKNAQEVGLSAPGVLIFGDPAETEETANRTIDWWISHPEYNIVLTTVQVYPGSVLWNNAIKDGVFPTLESQVEYVKAGCPKINVSGLDDRKFADLCKKLGELNQKRIVRLIEPDISNETWNDGRVKADVRGKCARCNSDNYWKSVNLIDEGGGEENFICVDCGQAHIHSFYDHFFRYCANNLSELGKSNMKVALWGQGRRLAMLYSSFKELANTNFFYVDNSPAKWGQYFSNMLIHNPTDLVELELDILIVATGEAHMNRVMDQINTLSARKKAPLAKRILKLGELFNPHFSVNRLGIEVAERNQ